MSMSRRTNKKKKFLQQEEISKLKQLKKEGWSHSRIASRFHISERHVRDLLKNNADNINKHFTKEEEQIIIQKYKENITKPSEINKFLPNKRFYMVRNQIKKMIRHGMLDQSTLPTVINSPVLVTEEISNDTSADHDDLDTFGFDFDSFFDN